MHKVLTILLLIIAGLLLLKLTLATKINPETFTEIYFEDPTSLPSRVDRFEEYNFKFSVHNLEYKDFEYQYSVYLQRDDQKIMLDEGTFNLKHDESKSISEEYGPLKNIRTKVVVELINKNQRIDFWMQPL